MKAIVTGGAGFIGHHLVSMLVEQGVDVYVLDKRTYAATKWGFIVDLIGSKNIVQSDVCDYESISILVAEINPIAAEKRHQQGWVDEITDDVDDAIVSCTCETDPVVMSSCC